MHRVAIALIIAGLITGGAAAGQEKLPALDDTAAKSAVPWRAQLLSQGADWCGTQEEFLKRFPGGAKDASCFMGPCDNPLNRDAAIPDDSTPIKTIKLFFHLFAQSDGSNPVATGADVEAQMLQLNADYLPARIQFLYDWRYVHDSLYREMRASEQEPMRELYALSPDDQLNVYVVQVQAGFAGQGTFPWDAAALGRNGGIVMDADAFGANHKTLTHEVGHNLGLWHTHHGVTEVPQCSACYERANGFDANRTGDFCADTAPTPVNFYCGPPGGSDGCSLQSWGETDPQNYMGYASDSCWTEFSPQQMGRMHCWMEWLSNWVTEAGDGRIELDQDSYNCDDIVSVRLNDEDLTAEAGAVVTLTSTSGDSETLTLAATTPGSFEGSIHTSGDPVLAEDGVLQVAEGATIRVTYHDAANAAGVPQSRNDAALAVCSAPMVSDVTLRFVGDTFAAISFTTSKPARGAVAYGAACGALSTTPPSSLRTEHTVALKGLTPGAQYHFALIAEDSTRNRTEADNGGSCYTFTTLTDFDTLTEPFDGRPDLAYTTLTFTPAATASGYGLCVEEASTLPASTNGATATFLGDDGSAEVILTGGKTFPFFGEAKPRLWINANGNITFAGGDSSWEGVIEVHNARPRISAMLVDFNPQQGGSILRQQLSDRYVVTYSGVSEFLQNDRSTFQVELFFDGVIRITYLQLEADFGVVGLSRGLGDLDPGVYTDLSASGECFAPPYIEGKAWVEAGTHPALRVITRGLIPPVHYDWLRNGQSLGVDSPTLQLAAVMETDSGRYRAVVHDASKATYVTDPFDLLVLPVGELPAAAGPGIAALITAIAALSLRGRRRR
jgi:hypothetical protein